MACDVSVIIYEFEHAVPAFGNLIVIVQWFELSLLLRTKELDIENEDLKKELDDYKKKCYEMETTL